MGVSRIYKAATPFPEAAVLELDYSQSADVVYFTHLDYPVQRATRYSHTDWVFSTVAFQPSLATPAAPTVNVIQPNTTGIMATTHHYKITALGGSPEEESEPSAEVLATNDLTLNGNINRLTLPAKPAGVTGYVIYKRMAGSFGYIGTTSEATFDDGSPQIQPVLSNAPPQGTDPFSAGAGYYPSTVTFHDQRLMLARSRKLPNAVWGSQPANFQNMDISRPAKDDDALSFALVSDSVNSVSQMASLGGALMLLTSDGVFATTGGSNGEPLSPTSILPKRSNSRGSSRLNPITLDDILFYTPNRGSSVRALGYKFEIDGYQSNNVSIFSPHLFKNYRIISWTYVDEPFAAIFAVRNDGQLLCMTWEAEQQVWGWTRIDSPGATFLQVEAISEDGYDRLYALVDREINGVVRRFHERLALPHIADITEACHLDSSVTQVYDPPSNVMTGLSHLEGVAVSAYYDGYVAHDLVVSGGAITLPNGYEASTISAGLRYTGEIETLPMVMQTSNGSLHTNMQNIAHMVLRTVDTRGIEAGITGADLEQVYERTGGEVGLPDVSQNDYRITPQGHWEEGVTITIQQNEPLPAHITAVFIEPKVSPK